MTHEEITQMQTAWKEFAAANDLLQKEVKQYGAANGALTEKVEKIQATFDALESKINTRMDAEEFAKQQKSLLEKIDELEAKLSRKGSFNNGEGDDKEKAKMAKKALMGALRFNPLVSTKSLDEYLGPELFKSLVLGNDSQGGYLAPIDYVNEMLMNAVEYAPIRQLCRVRPTTRTSIQQPKRTGTAAAAWVEEVGTRSETTSPTFGMVDIPTHEMYAMTKVSKQDLEDSAYDLEGFLRDEFSEQFGVTEADSLINGNGVGKPEGVLSNASIAAVNSGDANTLSGDSLIALYYELKEVYLINSTWVSNRSTLKTIRTLKTAVTGEYVWAPGIKTDARPATILDRPYITAPEMPTIAANAYPVLFGDFRRGMTIVDRLVMEMMSDPYSSKSTGMVEFSARRRVGAKVVLAEAIKKLKIAAA